MNLPHDFADVRNAHMQTLHYTHTMRVTLSHSMHARFIRAALIREGSLFDWGGGNCVNIRCYTTIHTYLCDAHDCLFYYISRSAYGKQGTRGATKPYCTNTVFMAFVLE